MRCNCGVNPKYLTDQWLIAEQVELLMIPGMLKKNKNVIKTKIPDKFKLGTGHMVFWCHKLKYLNKRHKAVKAEVKRRGFKAAEREIELDDFPKCFHNDWKPSKEDTDILRERLIWKIEQKPNQWRYMSKSISDVDDLKNKIINGEVYKV